MKLVRENSEVMWWTLIDDNGNVVKYDVLIGARLFRINDVFVANFIEVGDIF